MKKESTSGILFSISEEIKGHKKTTLSIIFINPEAKNANPVLS